MPVLLMTLLILIGLCVIEGTLPIIQQVMITAGALVLLGVLLATFWHVG